MTDKRPEYVIEVPRHHHKITLAPDAGYKAVFDWQPDAKYWPGRITLYDRSHAFFNNYKREHFRALRDWLTHVLDSDSPIEDEHDKG